MPPSQPLKIIITTTIKITIKTAAIYVRAAKPPALAGCLVSTRHCHRYFIHDFTKVSHPLQEAGTISISLLIIEKAEAQAQGQRARKLLHSVTS